MFVSCFVQLRRSGYSAAMMLVVIATVAPLHHASAQTGSWTLIDTVRDTTTEGRLVATTQLHLRSATASERRAVTAALSALASTSGQTTTHAVLRATYAPELAGDSIVVESLLSLSCARSSAQVVRATVRHAPPGLANMSAGDTVEVDADVIRKVCAARPGEVR